MDRQERMGTKTGNVCWSSSDVLQINNPNTKLERRELLPSNGIYLADEEGRIEGGYYSLLKDVLGYLMIPS